MAEVALKYRMKLRVPQPVTTCSKLTIETLKQGLKCVPKLSIKTSERRKWRHSGVFIVNFEHIYSNLLLVFLVINLTSWGTLNLIGYIGISWQLKAFKNDEKCFLLHLKNFFRSQDI